MVMGKESVEKRREKGVEMLKNGSTVGEIMEELNFTYAEVKKMALENSKTNIITYNKLVRDKVPSIIENSGHKANFRVLNEDEYTHALKDKLIEETYELINAIKRSEIIEELADIATVLMSIMSDYGITEETVIDTANKKAEEKGLFTQGYFLKSVERGNKKHEKI